MSSGYWTAEKRAEDRRRRLAHALKTGRISERSAQRFREDPTLPIHPDRPGEGTCEVDFVQLLEWAHDALGDNAHGPPEDYQGTLGCLMRWSKGACSPMQASTITLLAMQQREEPRAEGMVSVVEGDGKPRRMAATWAPDSPAAKQQQAFLDDHNAKMAEKQAQRMDELLNSPVHPTISSRGVGAVNCGTMGCLKPAVTRCRCCGQRVCADHDDHEALAAATEAEVSEGSVVDVP